MSVAGDMDLARLGAYLDSEIAGFAGLNGADKFSDGQSNPTYLLTADSGRYVLRRKPLGELLGSAHAVDREFRVQAALAGTDVPISRMHCLCEDESVIGSMFYVMEFVDGRTFWDPKIPALSNDERAAIYDSMNRTLTAIHSVDLEAAGLTDFGKPGSYFERQYARWTKQYRASETETIEAMEEVIDWLDANMVADDGWTTLVHGDYRLDNILMHKTEPRAAAVIDWELSTLGHPFADLAYQCMLWRMPESPMLSGFGDSDRTALGVPTERDYVSRYCERMEIGGIPDWEFYLVFGLFRLAAIVQGVKKRALMGNASSQRAMEVGALTAPLAEKAREILRHGAGG